MPVTRRATRVDNLFHARIFGMIQNLACPKNINIKSSGWIINSRLNPCSSSEMKNNVDGFIKRCSCVIADV